MISVSEALAIVEETSRRQIGGKSRMEEISLSKALGRFTARPLTARVDLPPFDNSAMDGFAIRSFDARGGSKKRPASLIIVGTIAAGDFVQRGGPPGTAVRIMTGAPIPPEFDSVIPLEEVEEEDGRIRIVRKVGRGENIRKQGKDIRSGQQAVSAGTRITPGAAAFLASAGIDTIPVLPLPRVSILVTGNELMARHRATGGKIVDSNSLFLSLALKEMGLTPQRIRRVRDNPKTLKKVLTRSLRDSDVLIVTGGVSVGERDFTKKALASSGVETLFWKVAQKPGKPLFFGTTGNAMVFGLPGNPFAVIACFTLYVRPALRLLMGGEEGRSTGHALIDHECVKSDDKAHFLKGAMVTGNGTGALRVKALSGQGSHRLAAMRETNLLITIPAHKRKIHRGEKVEVHFL